MRAWLLAGYLLYVTSFSRTQSCVGPERNDIQAELNGVNWKTLADQLNLQDQVASIQDICHKEIDIRPCYFREVVSRYIQSQPEESCDNTRRKIVTALEELRYVNEASRVRKLIVGVWDACKQQQYCDDSCLPLAEDLQLAGVEGQIDDEAVEETRGLIKELENEFHTIVLRAHKDMKENEVDAGQLRLSLRNLPADLKGEFTYFKKEIKDSLEDTMSVDDIFFITSDYWDYLNYSLLEHIIDHHASVRVREKMAKYVEKLEGFRRETRLVIFSKAHKRIPRSVNKQFRQMVTEHDMDWATATLEDIDNFRNDINNELFLSNFALLIYKVTHGSVQITWLVPESLVVLIQTSIKPSSPFMQNHNVTKLTIDGMIVYDNATGVATSDKSLIYDDYLAVSIASWVTSTFLECTLSARFIKLYTTRLTKFTRSSKLKLSHSRLVVLVTTIFCTVNSLFLTLILWGAVQQSLENVSQDSSVVVFLTIAAIMRLFRQFMEVLTFIAGIATRDFRWKNSNAKFVFGRISFSSFILLLHSSVLTYTFCDQETKVWSIKQFCIFIALCIDVIFRLIVCVWATCNSCYFIQATHFLKTFLNIVHNSFTSIVGFLMTVKYVVVYVLTLVRQRYILRQRHILHQQDDHQREIAIEYPLPGDTDGPFELDEQETMTDHIPSAVVNHQHTAHPNPHFQCSLLLAQHVYIQCPSIFESLLEPTCDLPGGSTSDLSADPPVYMDAISDIAGDPFPLCRLEISPQYETIYPVDATLITSSKAIVQLPPRSEVVVFSQHESVNPT